MAKKESEKTKHLAGYEEEEVITGQQEWLVPRISTPPRPQKEFWHTGAKDGPRGGIQLV